MVTFEIKYKLRIVMWKIYWSFGLLISSIPILARMLANYMNVEVEFDFWNSLNTIDISMMGLAINCTNVSETYHLISDNKKKQNKSKGLIGTLLILTIMLIIGLTLLLGGLYFAEMSSPEENYAKVMDRTLVMSIICTALSCVLSFFYVSKINSK